MTKFLVGTEAALMELLERTERIETDLQSLRGTIMVTFEQAVELLVEYTKALKAENVLLAANDEADAAAIAAAEAKVAETEASLAAAREEIASDTAEEVRLTALIGEVLPPAEEPPAEEPPMEEPPTEEPPAEEPTPEPTPEPEQAA